MYVYLTGGFNQAIESIFPETSPQLCIVHQIRFSLQYFASRDKKALMAPQTRLPPSPKTRRWLLMTSKRWTGLINEWGLAMNQFAIIFEGRTPDIYQNSITQIICHLAKNLLFHIK